MKRYPRLIVKEKSGFRNVTGNPVIILDSRGVPFYDTRDADKPVWEFNLPPGEYFVAQGKISQMVSPVRYDTIPLPKPERYKQQDPTLFKIEFEDNPNKCTIYWDKRKIVFDNKLKEFPLPTLMFILYHEHGHRYYKTEEYCDRYAANQMIDRGYNPSQVGESVMSLSKKQLPRKIALVTSLENADNYDNDADKPFVIEADSFPVLDDWGWDTYWDARDWMKWHRLNVEKYGLDEANRKFISAYHSASFGAASYNWRTFDREFKDYAKANGFYDALFTGLAGLIAKPGAILTGVVDAAGEVVTGVENVVKETGKTVTKVSKYTPVLLAVGGIAALFIVLPNLKTVWLNSK